MPKPYLTELDRIAMGLPSIDKLNRIQAEIEEEAILAEIFKPRFFAHVKGLLKAAKKDGASAYSNIFSVLEVDDQRKSLSHFLYLIKKNMKPERWQHLAQRITSDGDNVSLKSLFEVMIVGNLLKQLPDDCVQLDAPTIEGKDCDARVRLIDREVDIEVTMLDESEGAKNWNQRLASSGYAVGSGVPSESDGRRIMGHVKKKARDFCPDNPNVLVVQLFGRRDGTTTAMDNLRKENFKNIGLLMPFNRKTLVQKYIMTYDPTCVLTKEEKQQLLKLLNGDDFITLPFV